MLKTQQTTQNIEPKTSKPPQKIDIDLNAVLIYFSHIMIMNFSITEAPSRLHRTHPKEKFTPEEDSYLLELVNEHGEDDWALISSLMKGRNTRQCRERWNKYLSPRVNTSPWSKEEDFLLETKFKEMGARWKAIAKFFSQRTDINVKNRWLKLERHRRKRENKEKCSPKTLETIKPDTVGPVKASHFDWTQEIDTLFSSLDYAEINDEGFQWL